MSTRDAILNRLRKTVANGPPAALPAAAPRVAVTRVNDSSRPANCSGLVISSPPFMGAWMETKPSSRSV